MKAGLLFSAGAWGALAIATASLAAPGIAMAEERPAREDGRHGWGGRSNDQAAQGNREGRSGWRSEGGNADRARPAQAPVQQAPVQAPPRTNDAGGRHGGWGNQAGRMAQERAAEQARGNPRRDATPGNDNRDGRRGWNRGDNDSRSGTWRRDDDNRGGGDNRGNWRGDRSGWQDNRNDGRVSRDRDYRRDDRQHRDWDRNSWRRNDRYDWRSYRDNHRSAYRIGRYYAPYYGYSYRRIGIGITLGSLFYGNRYWIDDPWYYRLPEVYGPYRWVRYYDDVLLVNIYTGEVVDVIYDFFW